MSGPSIHRLPLPGQLPIPQALKPGKARVVWSSVPGVQYRIYDSPNLTAWNLQPREVVAEPGTDVTVSDAVFSGPFERRFFRVETDGPR